MCLTPEMRQKLEQARMQLCDVIETLSDMSEEVECDDLIRCEDGYLGSHEPNTRYLGRFPLPNEASPLTMAARLYSWLGCLQQRLDEKQHAQN